MSEKTIERWEWRKGDIYVRGHCLSKSMAVHLYNDLVDAIERSEQDLVQCMVCGLPVLSCSEGLALCQSCAEANGDNDDEEMPY